MTRLPFLKLAGLTAITAIALLVSAGRAEAQFGSLVSPGPLARAHSELNGLNKCAQCHEAGRGVTAERCLTCHKPIAERMARKTGVHRAVTNDCVKCHVEHAGVDAELRPFDTARFDHAKEAGYPLDGRHAPAADKCASCHKTRSFLTASVACSACHADTHKGSLGDRCERCHSTAVSFKEAVRGFDHGVTAYPLVGAHRTVACASCHLANKYKGVKFQSCMDCHRTPHPATMSTTCTTCHSNDTWRTRKFDHSQTNFPLIGKHVSADCASCHKAPATKVKPAAATCATCHADPHRGGFRQDCRACHTEASFKGAAFDHAKNTTFALADGHAGRECRACHTSVRTTGLAVTAMTVDFRGLKTACASCHADPHRADLGPGCETCHSARTFRVAAFTHPKAKELFTGRHAPLACSACHVPAAKSRLPAAPFTATPSTCASCHRDVHLGQVGPDCQTCHSVSGVKFAADRFAHDRSPFKLTGKHTNVECAKCHKAETGVFPSGQGTAVRLKGLGATCQSCHADPHLGQVSSACETCHGTNTFTVSKYAHRTPPREFFVGRHVSARCDACHKKVTGAFPGGQGTAVQFAIKTTCVACHTDVHNGALGQDCQRCHRPEPLAPAHPRSRATAIVELSALRSGDRP